MLFSEVISPQGARIQLLEVMESFRVQMKSRDLFSRCIKCNNDSYIYVSPGVIEELQRFSEVPHQREKWIECSGGQIDLSSGCTDDGVKIGFGKILPAVIEKMEEFFICRTCGKCYWDGEHDNGTFRDVVRQFIVSDGVESDLQRPKKNSGADPLQVDEIHKQLCSPDDESFMHDLDGQINSLSLLDK